MNESAIFDGELQACYRSRMGKIEQENTIHQMRTPSDMVLGMNEGFRTNIVITLIDISNVTVCLL